MPPELAGSPRSNSRRGNRGLLNSLPSWSIGCDSSGTRPREYRSLRNYHLRRSDPSSGGLGNDPSWVSSRVNIHVCSRNNKQLKRKNDSGKSLSKNTEELSPTATVSSGIASIPGKSVTSQVLASSIAPASGSSILGNVLEPLGQTL